jgi:hypothetical protein
MFPSLIRKLASWVEYRELARSVKRKEQQLPPFPKDDDPRWDERGDLEVVAEHAKAREAVAATLFTAQEQQYRDQQAAVKWARFKLKAERKEAGAATASTSTSVVLGAGTASLTYLVTKRIEVTAVLTLLAWAILSEYNNYRLWRYRAECRLRRLVLRDIHTVFIDTMPNDFDQLLRVESAKQPNGRLAIVGNKSEADATLAYEKDGDRMYSPVDASSRSNVFLVDRAGNVAWSYFVSQAPEPEWEAKHLLAELSNALNLG